MEQIIKEKIRNYFRCTDFTRVNPGGVFTQENMNSRRLSNALSNYAPKLKSQDVLLLVDTSGVLATFGNGKKGLIFTDEEIYFYDPEDGKWNIKYTDIDDCKIFSKSSYNEFYSGLMIILKDGSQKKMKKSLFNKNSMCDVIRDIINIVNLYEEDVDGENTDNDLDYEETLIMANWEAILEDLSKHSHFPDILVLSTAHIMATKLEFSYIDGDELHVQMKSEYVQYFYPEVRRHFQKELGKYVAKHVGLKKTIVIDN